MADSSILTTNLSHQNRITAHWIIQVCAFVLFAIAQICIFTNKARQEKPHFQTTHSIFGLITLILTMLSAIGGIFTKYAMQLRNTVKPVVLKCFHSFAGITVYILAMITIILGFNQMWNEDKDAYIKPILIILIIIIAFFVLIKSFVLFLSRFNDILKR
jgi:cytochrome b561